ncbi:MAG: molybdenum ABC transporter ATP-binding protein [Alphaproteobacteria bacterium]|nr:molybdenum ABC transporter ATP-binding protein [Alphaproteobacteria bacterium]
MPAAISVRLRHEVPGFVLDVGFEAAQGITVLFGRSGAGKTMVVDALAGLVRPSAGRIALGGRVLFDRDAGIDLAPERRRIGYVFQDSRLFPHLSVANNLRYGWRRLAPAERRIGFDRVVALLGIEALLGRRPHRLSGGERQRVAIGRALLANPELLLMDEPLASLDRPRRDEILPFIEQLGHDAGVPIIYVTHAVDELVRLATTVVVLERGTVVAAGPLEATMLRPDLAPYIGGAEAGAVVAVTVARHDPAYALTHLAFAGGELVVPRLDLPEGARLRVRIHARDVALARVEPAAISTLNVLCGKVTAIAPAEGPQVDVLIDVGILLWARITRKSAVALELAAGTPIHALVKSVAVDAGLQAR